MTGNHGRILFRVPLPLYLSFSAVFAILCHRTMSSQTWKWEWWTNWVALAVTRKKSLLTTRKMLCCVSSFCCYGPTLVGRSLIGESPAKLYVYKPNILTYKLSIHRPEMCVLCAIWMFFAPSAEAEMSSWHICMLLEIVQYQNTPTIT